MSDKKENHYLYALTFDAEPKPVVFYIGHTNKPKRRESEHRSSAKDPSNTEYKYQWCRELEAVGIKWDFVVLGEIEDDEDAEYEWVLKFARDNKSRGITFIDGLPLTNMKAGDFLTEILDRTDIRTKSDIKSYKKAVAAQRAQVSYSRNQSSNYVPTERMGIFKEYLHELGEAASAKSLEEKTASAERAKKKLKVLNSTARKNSLEDETVAMIGREIDRGTKVTRQEVEEWMRLIGSHVRNMETMYDPTKPGAASKEEHEANIALGYARITELKAMLGDKNA